MKTKNKPCKRKKCPYYYMHGYSEKCASCDWNPECVWTERRNWRKVRSSLSNVESHYEKNGVRVIDDFKIDSVSLVSDPVDEYCKLNLVKER